MQQKVIFQHICRENIVYELEGLLSKFVAKNVVLNYNHKCI